MAETIDGILARLRRRQRWLNALQYAAHGLLAGSVLALSTALVAAVARADWSSALLWWSLAWMPAGLVFGALAGLVRRLDALVVARSLDRATDNEDRFASALQLIGHHRQARVRLIVADALSAVSRTTAGSALPMRVPAGLRWLPLTVISLAVVFLVAPSPRLEAEPPAPEVTAEQWQTLHEDFRKALDELPPPRTSEEAEIVRQLERIAAMLAEKPQKKEALAELAKMRAELERRRKSVSARDLSMRDAARAVRSSRMLQRFASKLREGRFGEAAKELRSLAQRLADNELRMTAADFEAMAQDFEQLSLELAPRDQLSQACQRCAGAAGSMNRQSLADALRRLASSLDQDADQLRRYQSSSQARNLLDELRRQLNQCSSCNSCSGRQGGCSACQGNGPAAFVRRNNKKGGLQAGWGTADDWSGGTVDPAGEMRLPDIAETRETAGTDTSFTTVSTDEDAESAVDFKSVYADLVQKAEADLDLEMIPVSYREYLRRYFRAIRPQEDTLPETPDG